MPGLPDECPVCQVSNVMCREIASAVPSSGKWEPMRGREHGYLIQCPACGDFVVTYTDRVNLSSPTARKREAWKLSALLQERTIRLRAIQPNAATWLRFGSEPYGELQFHDLAPIDLDDLMRTWPRTLSERLDRVLCNIVRRSAEFGQVLGFEWSDASTCRSFFAWSAEAAMSVVDALDELGRVAHVNKTQGGCFLSVSAAGWAHYEELSRAGSSRENPVFVAMWFGNEEPWPSSETTTRQQMKRLYDEGIQPAVERAGYRVTRVDLEDFNDGVMDRVIGDIRAAPFVVADFTGHRNGVYYEVGFARGLGHPVVHTCHKKDMQHAHFDTAHINHLVWDDLADLQERLYQRIRATIGQGPYAPEQARKDSAAR